MKKSLNIYYISISFLSYLFDYYSQKRFFKKYKPIQKILYRVKYIIRRYDLYRIKDYSIRLYALLGGVNKYINGKKINYNQRCRLSLLSAFTPLYDDFIDKTRSEIVKLKLFVRNPLFFMPVNLTEQTGYDILKLLLNNYNENIKKIFPAAYKAHLMQIISKNQKNGNLSLNEITQITYAKGGYSALLCRYMLDMPFLENEYNVWYQYGAFLQLLDDIYDIKKDYDENIRTIPTTITNISELNEILDINFLKLVQKIQLVNYSQTNKKYFLYRIALIYIAAKGILFQLNKNQNNNNGIINLEKLSKNDTEFRYLSLSNFIYMFKLAMNLNFH